MGSSFSNRANFSMSLSILALLPVFTVFILEVSASTVAPHLLHSFKESREL